MALSSRSQLYPRTASFCTGLAQRQGCCCCWIDALLQQWTRRGPGPQAQIGQAIDVWPCQTSSVTATLAPCGLIGTDTNLRSEWYNKGNDEGREEDLLWEQESHEPQLIIQ